MRGNLVGITHAGEVAAADVVHVVEAHLAAHLLAEKGRVLVCGSDVVVHEGDVHTAEAVDACRRGDVQKVIGRRAVLCGGRRRRQQNRRGGQ